MVTYAYMIKGQWIAPVSMCSKFNGIRGWHLLTDAERAKHGWYPCELINAEYNPLIESRTSTPINFEFDGQIVRAIYQKTTKDIQTVIAEKCRLVDEMRKERLYTNIVANFPAGEKVIQFRDEVDRANLANTASGAMTLIMAGTPDAILAYRTEDNETQMLRADQMLQIAMQALGQKQQVINTSWAHKDTLRAMTTVADVLAYDITVGW